MKIAVVGAGNMGGAVARGLVKAGTVGAADVTVSDLSDAVLQRFSENGYNVTQDNARAVRGADVVFLVVKPWLVEEVLKGLKSSGGFLRHELAERLSLRHTPELVWTEDHSITYGARILDILSTLDIPQDEPEAEDTDRWALDNGYVAITPTRIDVTAYEAMEKLRVLSL